MNVKQIITIDWYPIAFGEMPDAEGTYFVAFSDGTVESYPMDHRDIKDGEVMCGQCVGEFWAQSPPHPVSS